MADLIIKKKLHRAIFDESGKIGESIIWTWVSEQEHYTSWVELTTPEDRMETILDSLSPKDLEEWMVGIDKRMEGV